MKATSHFAMAHLLNAALQNRGVFLDRVAFVYGNIAPDYTPAMWVYPHFNKVCSKMIAEITTELPQMPIRNSGRVGAYYSKQLGLLCHFLCDYFCFAHNDDFPGNIRQHISYENELDSYLRCNCLKILDIDGTNEILRMSDEKKLISSIDSTREKYLKAGFSQHNDLSFAFEACMSAIMSILALSKQVHAASTSIELDDFIASLKGYATGNCLVFRMFLFKYRNANLFFIPALMPPIGVNA